MANIARGETTLKLGGDTFVLAATMEGLANLSAATGCQTLQDLYGRLVGSELATTLAAFRAFVQSGVLADGTPLKRKEAAVAAAGAFLLTDAGAVQSAFLELLAAFTRSEPSAGVADSGNGDAATA